MPYQTTLIYSEILIRRAVLAFWWRSVGFGFPVALGLIAFSLADLLYQGNTSWVVGVLASVLFVGIAFIATIYFVHLANSMQKFRTLGDPQAIFTVDEDSFTFSSAAGQSTLPWQSIIDGVAISRILVSVIFQIPVCYLANRSFAYRDADIYRYESAYQWRQNWLT